MLGDDKLVRSGVSVGYGPAATSAGVLGRDSLESGGAMTWCMLCSAGELVDCIMCWYAGAVWYTSGALLPDDGGSGERYALSVIPKCSASSASADARRLQSLPFDAWASARMPHISHGHRSDKSMCVLGQQQTAHACGEGGRTCELLILVVQGVLQLSADVAQALDFEREVGHVALELVRPLA